MVVLFLIIMRNIKISANVHLCRHSVQEIKKEIVGLIYSIVRNNK